MTKVSRLPLRQDVWERIFDLFIETLTNIRQKGKLTGFVDDFFSPTEKIMFAKRLAAALLIAKGHDYLNIRKILRISPPTIAKMSFRIKYEGKGLNSVIEDIFKRQRLQIIWKEMEDLFDLPSKGTLKSPERLKRQVKRDQIIRRIKEEF